MKRKALGEKIAEGQDVKRNKSSRPQDSACPAKSLRDFCGELPGRADAYMAAGIAKPVVDIEAALAEKANARNMTS